jgi:hypothetical protein
MKNDMFPLFATHFDFETTSLNGDGINQDGNNNYDGKSEPREEIVFKPNEVFNSHELVTFAIWGRVYSKDKPLDIDTLGKDIGNYL